MSYQGHKNYPTWSVALWLSNDEGLYHEARRIVRRNPRERDAEDALKAFIDELLPDLSASFASDILGWAMEQVDWSEVRETFEDESEDEGIGAA